MVEGGISNSKGISQNPRIGNFTAKLYPGLSCADKNHFPAIVPSKLKFEIPPVSRPHLDFSADAVGIGADRFPVFSLPDYTRRQMPQSFAGYSTRYSHADLPPFRQMSRWKDFWNYRNRNPQVLRHAVFEPVDVRDEKVKIPEAFDLLGGYMDEGRLCLFGDVHNSPLHAQLFLEAVRTMAEGDRRRFAVGLELPHNFGGFWNFADLEEIEKTLPLMGFRQPEVAIPFHLELIKLCRDNNLPMVALDNYELAKPAEKRAFNRWPAEWDRNDLMAQRVIDFQEIDGYINRYGRVGDERDPDLPVLAFLGGDHAKSTGIQARIPDAVSFMLTLSGVRWTLIEKLLYQVVGKERPYFNYLII